MNRNHIRRRFTHGTSTDIVLDLSALHRLLGQRQRGTQPIRQVIVLRKVAHIVNVTANEWHDTELLQARSSRTQVLLMRLFIATEVEQAEAFVMNYLLIIIT